MNKAKNLPMYLVDGNNLIGKINTLQKIKEKDKQGSREKLAFMLDNFFNNKKVNVYLHLDGFPGAAIKTNNIRIIYSERKPADDTIKYQVEQTQNRKKITVVTSDRNLSQFARVCSCTVITSEDFARQLKSSGRNDDEENIIKNMSVEEFKKLFKA